MNVVVLLMVSVATVGAMPRWMYSGFHDYYHWRFPMCHSWWGCYGHRIDSFDTIYNSPQENRVDATTQIPDVTSKVENHHKVVEYSDEITEDYDKEGSGQVEERDVVDRKRRSADSSDESSSEERQSPPRNPVDDAGDNIETSDSDLVWVPGRGWQSLWNANQDEFSNWVGDHGYFGETGRRLTSGRTGRQNRQRSQRRRGSSDSSSSDEDMRAEMETPSALRRREMERYYNELNSWRPGRREYDDQETSTTSVIT